MPTTPAAGGAVDVYLKVQTKKAGTIKGEAHGKGHVDEIVVHGWNWGVAASAALGSTERTGRRSYKCLTVSKQLDKATTSLMSVLAYNDEVKEARLCMRKAGEGQVDFFTIVLKEARVNSIDIDCDEHGNAIERVSFAFNSVQVEYLPQLASGLRGGGSMFQDDITPSA